MRIALLIESLEGGGAARVLTTMANHWASHNHRVTLLSFEQPGRPSFYPLHPGVEVIHVPRILPTVSSDTLNNLTHLRRIRKAILELRPQAAISFIDTTNLRVLLALLGSDIPVIVSERVDPAHYYLGRIPNYLRRLLYPLARAIVVQTRTCADYFPSNLQKKISVIPNPVLAPIDLWTGGGKRIIAAGRLCPQKGFDLLLRAAADPLRRHPDWSLAIFGEGQERPHLLRLAKELQIDAQTMLPGNVSDLSKEFRRSDLFVLSSRFEGFPNVLCEAMACGMPVVAFDCPSGPAEIIRDGTDGLLVPAEKIGQLSKSIARLMADQKLRERLGMEALQVTKRFSLTRTMASWEQLLNAPPGYK